MRMNCCRLITNLFNMYLQEKGMPLLFITPGGEEVGRVSLFKETELLGRGGAWKRRGQNSFWSFAYAITAPNKRFRTGYLLNTSRVWGNISFLGRMTLCIPLQTLLVQTDFPTKVRCQCLLQQQQKKWYKLSNIWKLQNQIWTANAPWESLVEAAELNTC